MDFENRVALVTGGTGALGGAVVMDLLQHGARVTVTYRSSQELEALERRAGKLRDRLEGANVDLTEPGVVSVVVRELKDRCGRIDFISSIAGGFAAGKIYETDDTTWRRMFDINFWTLVNVLRPVIPLMIEQNFGRVVSVSSGAILDGGGAGIAAYAVSKGAVRQLSEILASEVKDYDIKVHCVMPGTMDTEANRRAMPSADFSKWVKTEEVVRVIHELLRRDKSTQQPVTVPVLT
jgi:NAD(P)-dependent dehydrogenase (short-subunit alcohol dehydrogenase family)